jgi:1-phosphatidylinositol-3-phosphate 5-kinase
VVGLIDFIRTYTWDKQLETWVKASGILGGAGREPTIVSPRSYARRLRGAIRGYFTVVPDGRDVPPPLDPDAA